MSEPETGGSFRNREHYFKASMIGGGVAAVLSVTPIINWLNLFFLALVILGGGLATYWVQKKTGSVDAMEGAAIGALAGVVCGLLLFALGMCLSTGFAFTVLPDMSRRESREFTVILMGLLSSSCCLSFTLYPLFSALGGMITPLIWPPTEGPAAQPKGEPSEEDKARRKKMMRAVLGSLGGCLGVTMLFCVVSGYLAYLQSRGPEDTAGEEAIVSAPVVVGERITLQIPAVERDHTEYGVWLVADDPLPAMYGLEGRIGCRDLTYYSGDGDPYMGRIYHTAPDASEPSWLFLEPEYVYGRGGSRCVVEIEHLPAGVTNPRIVVTQLHEPSDWL